MNEPKNAPERSKKLNAWITISLWLIGYDILMHSDSLKEQFPEYFDGPLYATNLLAFVALGLFVVRMVMEL